MFEDHSIPSILSRKVFTTLSSSECQEPLFFIILSNSSTKRIA